MPKKQLLFRELCKCCANRKIKNANNLINRLLAFFVAVWTGLEPATPCVTGRYSNQLNYHTLVLLFFVFLRTGDSPDILGYSNQLNYHTLVLLYYVFLRTGDSPDISGYSNQLNYQTVFWSF